VTSGIQRAQAVVSAVLAVIGAAMSSAWNNMANAVSNAWAQIVVFVANGINNAASTIGRLPGILGAMAGQMVSAGINMMQGFVNGIASMAGRIIQSAVDAVGGAINAVRSLLNLGSPSKLFRQFGEWTGEGLAIGMENMSDLIRRTAESMADAATHAFSAKEMYAQGREASIKLGEGLQSNAATLDKIISDMTPTMTAKFNAMGSLPTPTPTPEAEQANRSVVFENGAFQLVTPTKDPELVVHQVMDEFANNSNF
jgi:phage-related protein